MSLKTSAVLSIGTLVVRDLKGAQIAQSHSVTNLAVYPDSNSKGVRAQGVIIYPGGDCYFNVQPNVNTVVGARLMAATEYIFPLYPKADTISILDAQSTTADTHVRWVRPGL